MSSQPTEIPAALERELDGLQLHVIYDYLRKRVIPQVRHGELRIAFRNARYDRTKVLLLGNVRD